MISEICFQRLHIGLREAVHVLGQVRKFCRTRPGSSECSASGYPLLLYLLEFLFCMPKGGERLSILVARGGVIAASDFLLS